MAIIERSRSASVDLRVVDPTDGPAEVARAMAEVPDVIAVGIQPGAVHPLQVAREAAERIPATRILILAVREQAAHAYQAVRIGAWGWVDPAAGPDELHAAAEAVAQGEAVLGPRHAAWVLRELESAGQPEPGNPPAPDQLTVSERTVLLLLAEGTSPQAVADHLGVSTRVIGRHAGSAVARLHRRYRRPSSGTDHHSPAVG